MQRRQAARHIDRLRYNDSDYFTLRQKNGQDFLMG